MITTKLLMTRHPWVTRMCGADWWPKIRYVTSGWSEELQRHRYLARGKFEKDDHYDVRIKMSEPAGVTEEIVDDVVAAIFRVDPSVDYANHADVAEWAEDVDGNKTTLTEWMREHAGEPLRMGVAAIMVDTNLTPEVKAEAQGDSIAALPEAPKPLLVPLKAEQIFDWAADSSGKLLWITVVSIVHERASHSEPRKQFVEVTVFDRTHAAKYKIEAKNEGFDLTALGVADLPNIASQLSEPTLSMAPTPHGCGCVPVVPWHGASTDVTMQVVPPYIGSVRMDVAAYNSDSQARFARYLHLVPFLRLKLAGSRNIDEVIRSPNAAIVLNSEANEDADYATTDGASFELAMRAVEADRMEAYRKSGTEPSGEFKQSGAEPESGVAKQTRMRASTERKMLSIAEQCEMAHWAVLDLAARRLNVRPNVGTDAVFTGTVSYSRDFQPQDIERVVGLYTDVRGWIDSPQFHRHMLGKMATQIAVDMDPAASEKMQSEISSLTDEKISETLQAEVERETAGLNADE